MSYSKYPTEAHMLRHIENTSEPVTETGCTIWLGSLNHKGYGQCFYKGKMRRVHRIIYELVKAVIPDGLQVLHKCDVRCCINPDHLHAGTPQDNSRDTVLRNRYPNRKLK